VGAISRRCQENAIGSQECNPESVQEGNAKENYPQKELIQLVGMKRLPMFLLFFAAGILVDRLLDERFVEAQGSGPASLTFEAAKVTIGMTKEKALSTLSAYSVGPTSATERSFVMTKNAFSNGGNHFSVLGSIKFEKGLVSSVSRNWGDGQSGMEVDKLWKSLWGATTSNFSSSPYYRPLSMRVHADSTPQGQSQTIDMLVAPDHVVSIQRNELINSPLAIVD
jgi:hypothetical protein